MDENTIREFLINCGLKPKEIADRLSMKDRTIHSWLKGKRIAPYMCQLVELTFSNYDIKTGQKLSEPGEEYITSKDIIEKKEEELTELRKENSTLKEYKAMQDKTINLMEDQIKLLKFQLNHQTGNGNGHDKAG